MSGLHDQRLVPCYCDRHGGSKVTVGERRDCDSVRVAQSKGAGAGSAFMDAYHALDTKTAVREETASPAAHNPRDPQSGDTLSMKTLESALPDVDADTGVVGVLILYVFGHGKHLLAVSATFLSVALEWNTWVWTIFRCFFLTRFFAARLQKFGYTTACCEQLGCAEICFCGTQFHNRHKPFVAVRIASFNMRILDSANCEELFFDGTCSIPSRKRRLELDGDYICRTLVAPIPKMPSASRMG